MKTKIFFLSAALFFLLTAGLQAQAKKEVHISQDSAQDLLQSVIGDDPWDSTTTKALIIAINNGANVESRYGSVFQHVLECAAEYGDLKVAELLLQKGADIDGADADGFTALHMAAYKTDKKMMALLLKHNPMVNKKDNYGRTAYDLTDNKEIKEMLAARGGKSGEN